jgi:hypothetical protein
MSFARLESDIIKYRKRRGIPPSDGTVTLDTSKHAGTCVHRGRRAGRSRIRQFIVNTAGAGGGQQDDSDYDEHAFHDGLVEKMRFLK